MNNIKKAVIAIMIFFLLVTIVISKLVESYFRNELYILFKHILFDSILVFFSLSGTTTQYGLTMIT